MYGDRVASNQVIVSLGEQRVKPTQVDIPQHEGPSESPKSAFDW